MKLFEKLDKNGFNYSQYFYSVIKKLIDEGKLEINGMNFFEGDPEFFNYFNQKRQLGENNSFISSLIREDLIKTT